MMDTQVDRELLEKIADLVGKPVGAFIGRPPSNGTIFAIRTNYINVTKILFYCSGDQ